MLDALRTAAVPAAADQVNSGILTTARLTIASTSAVPAANGLSDIDEFDPTNTTLVQGTATPNANGPLTTALTGIVAESP